MNQFLVFVFFTSVIVFLLALSLIFKLVKPDYSLKKSDKKSITDKNKLYQINLYLGVSLLISSIISFFSLALLANYRGQLSEKIVQIMSLAGLLLPIGVSIVRTINHRSRI